MKRVYAYIILLLLLVFNFLFCTSSIYASESQKIVEEFNQVLPDGFTVDLSDSEGSYLGLDRILAEIISSIEGKNGEIVSFFLTLFGFSILLCIVKSGSSIFDSGIDKSVSVSVLTLASVSIFSSILPLFESLRDTLSTLCTFFGGALPVLTSVTTLMAESTTASVQAANMSVTLAIIELFSVKALMPLAFTFFAISFIGGVGEGSVSTISKGVKGAFMWGVGIISTVIAAIVSIQSVVASAHDSALLRAARYAASGTIPIVGTTVASALGTLGGGLAFVKSTIGASSIAVILSITLSPLLILLLYRLAFSLCTSFLELASASEGARCFSAFQSSIDVIIAVYSMSTLLCIVELVVFIKGGVGMV